MNACHSLLARSCATALELAGLDPWAGLYHADRPGRPALALDPMEPLRLILADSTVLMALNNGELSPSDFITVGPGCNLTVAGRRMLHVQARLLARHLLGEFDRYTHHCPR